MFSLAVAMAAQAEQWFSHHPDFPCLTGDALRSIKSTWRPNKRKYTNSPN